MKKYFLIALACLALAVPQTATAQDETPDNSRYILTPKAPETPRINGPKVYGARRKADFLFRIPTTGARPMTWSAKGLPRGLKLNKSTGIISGKARRKGEKTRHEEQQQRDPHRPHKGFLRQLRPIWHHLPRRRPGNALDKLRYEKAY